MLSELSRQRDLVPHGLIYKD